MNERYYVLCIQYNREKEAENRTAPKGFDTLNEAKREFHNQLAKDMGNVVIGWSLVQLLNSDGGIYATEKYIADPLPEEV